MDEISRAAALERTPGVVLCCVLVVADASNRSIDINVTAKSTGVGMSSGLVKSKSLQLGRRRNFACITISQSMEVSNATRHTTGTPLSHESKLLSRLVLGRRSLRAGKRFPD